MTLKKIILTITTAVFCYFTAEAQAQVASADSTLSLREAVAEALQNNHSIKIAENALDVAGNNATVGNANLLPSISATASTQYSNSNTEQTIADFSGAGNPRVQNVDGAVSKTQNAALTATYTLFDGFGNIYTYEKLKTTKELSDLQLQQQMEQTVLGVVQAYANALQAFENYKVALASIERSNVRFQTTTERFEKGLTTGVEALSAEVDLNTDSLAYRNYSSMYRQALNDLYLLMGRDDFANTQNLEAIQPEGRLVLADLLTQAEQYNSQLQQANISLDISQLDYKITKAGYMPKLNATASYSYSKQTNDAGFLLESKNNGLQAGLTLSLNVFDGFKRSTRIQNAKLSVRNAQIQQDLSAKTIKKTVLNAWEVYQTALYQIKTAETSLKTADLNHQRSLDLYNKGQLTNVQIREAELNLNQAQVALTNFKLQAYIAETQLQQLAGQLVKNRVH